MMYSVATSYALRALACLPEGGTLYLAKDVADYLGLPGPYLSKILQALAQDGLLHSVRGPKGGYRLARPGHRITVRQVAAALDGGAGGASCPLGFSDCVGAAASCPFQGGWCELRAAAERALDSVTVRDLQRLDLRSPAGQPRLHRPAQGPGTGGRKAAGDLTAAS